MDPWRASVLAAETGPGGREAAWEAVLDAVEVGHGLATGPVDPGLACWTEPGAERHLAATHESTVAGRVGSGTFYTPHWLVEWILDRVLEPDSPQVVLDPACGCGAFLVPVVRRLVAAGRTPAQAVAQVRGVDLDPVAVAITRLLLRIEAPGLDPDVLETAVRVGDGLGEHPPVDVVVGNPPFRGRLRRAALAGREAAPAAYTDTSAVFLARALELAPGGRVAMVQPLSLLAARDSAAVRAAVARAGRLTDLWTAPGRVFPGASVLTCVPVIDLSAAPEHPRPVDPVPVRAWHGAPPVPGPRVAMPPEEWGPLAAPALGVPPVSLRDDTGTLGDLGPCTADFRDQYYGLVPHVREHADLPDGTRLVTAGLIDPAQDRWGSAPTRFARRAWAAPVVDLGSLHAEGRLSAWATARLVPKVLVAAQGRVIEAVVDEDGSWLPSVPVVTLTPPPDRLWHVLAVLLAPPVVAAASARYAGAAMSRGALKLSARQCAALPLPLDRVAWEAGAALAREAQHAPTTQARRTALVACAETMTAAYGCTDAATVVAWWRERSRT